MTRAETNAAIAEQTALDSRPDHLSKLVHAHRIGGEDFAVEVLADMHDLVSDAECEAVMERARAIATDMRPIDPETPGTLMLQRIAEILGAPETYWTVRSWVSQGAPHEGYGSTLRCDPVALAAWCETKANGIALDSARIRFQTLAQRLAEAA